METGSKGVVRGRFNRALSSEREGGRHTRALGRGGNQRSWASPSPPHPALASRGRLAEARLVAEGPGRRRELGAGRQPDSLCAGRPQSGFC